MRTAKIAGLVTVFLAAIVAANLITTHYGPSASIYNAFFLIGLDFITRDRLADFWGTTRWPKMIALIAVGGGLSYAVNSGSGKVAVASMVAFSAAELAEAVAYHVLRKRQWLERAPKAALLAAGVDSLIFPTIAFGGVMWSITFGQFVAKVAGAAVWAFVVARWMPAPKMAPELPGYEYIYPTTTDPF